MYMINHRKRERINKMISLSCALKTDVRADTHSFMTTDHIYGVTMSPRRHQLFLLVMSSLC